MMMIPSYYFKLWARKALKGNWQTALLISFFASIFVTVLQVLLSVLTPDYLTNFQLQLAQLMQSPSQVSAADLLALEATLIPDRDTLILLAVMQLALVFTPVLMQGSNAYFLARLKGKELGFQGLFCRMRSFGKAFLLYLLIMLRVLAWSLLLIVPGIIAAMRYSLAPYYLAEDPTRGVNECIQKSKATMNGAKMSLFMLLLSFVGWTLLSSVVQLMLMEVSNVAGIAAGLGIQLFVTTYTNAATAAFYRTLSDKRMQNRQSMSPEEISHALSAISGLTLQYGGMPSPFGGDMQGSGFRPGASDQPDDDGTGDADDDDADDDGTDDAGDSADNAGNNDNAGDSAPNSADNDNAGENGTNGADDDGNKDNAGDSAPNNAGNNAGNVGNNDNAGENSTNSADNVGNNDNAGDSAPQQRR